MQPMRAQQVQSSNEFHGFSDFREGPDRRTRPTRPFSRYTLVGRRVRNRRTTDALHRYYVDRAEGPWLWALVAIVVMIVLDGVFTLHILSRGGVEVNPIMNWIYGRGWAWFLGVKLATASVAFPFLSVHRYFRAATVGAVALLLAYGGVMVLHAYTLLQIHA